MIKYITFLIKNQFFITRNNILILVLPILIINISYFVNISFLSNIHGSIVSVFIGILSIIMGFLINFLVLTKSDSNTLLNKPHKDYKKCKEESLDDTDKIDDCKLKYKDDLKEVFIKLNFWFNPDKEVCTETNLYIYNKVFFIIMISILFPLFYFIFINFINILPIYVIKIIILYFILFYLLNVINLLIYIYLLFFPNDEIN